MKDWNMWSIGWRIERDAEITHGDPPMYKFHNKFVYFPVWIDPENQVRLLLEGTKFGTMTKKEAVAMAKLLNASQPQ